MGYIIRTVLVLIVTSFGTQPVRAQATATAPVNCDALKNSLVPYQVKFSANGSVYSIQVFRDKSGAATVWTLLPVAPVRSITRAVEYNGFGSETESVDSVQEATRIVILSHFRTRTRYAELDTKTFDYKKDATFKQYSHVEVANGPSPRDSESLVDYRFLREEQVTINGCRFSSVLFEGARSIGGRKSQAYYRYLPELRLRVSNSASEPRVDDITTVFESLKLPPL
jgi:hypothetical protein